MNRQKIWAKSSWTKIKVLIVSVFLWPQQKPNTKSQAVNITVSEGTRYHDGGACTVHVLYSVPVSRHG